MIVTVRVSGSKCIIMPRRSDISASEMIVCVLMATSMLPLAGSLPRTASKKLAMCAGIHGPGSMFSCTWRSTRSAKGRSGRISSVLPLK